MPSGAILTRERHMVLIRFLFLMEDTEANESNEHLYRENITWPLGDANFILSS